MDIRPGVPQTGGMSDDGVGAERALVVGDLNPDLIVAGDVLPRFGQIEQLLERADLVIGGSAGITAHGLARLGRPVSLLAAIGDDTFGTEMTSALAAAGVDTSTLVRRPAEQTGLSIILSAVTDRAILTLPGAIPSLDPGDLRTAIKQFAADSLRHIHVCSLFLQPTLAGGLAEALAEAKAAGLTTSLDTNDDPADRWAGIKELLPHLDLLLPNRREALALAHSIGSAETDLCRAGQALATLGPLVVVKDGAAGAIAINATGEVARAAATPSTGVDSTGAGDSFNAAFLDSWLRSLPLAECLRRGVTAGTYSIRAVGGTAAQPTLDLLVDDRRTP
jgi:ribokinase